VNIRKAFKQFFEINIRFRVKQEQMKHNEKASAKLNSPDFVDPVDKIEQGENGNYQTY